MMIAGLIAHKNGLSYVVLGDAIIGGVSSALGAIFILLAVGALIGTCNMAGTIPTIVDYGIRVLDPAWFYVAVAIICAVTGLVTGSSWTTAGTLGVAFVGISKVLGMDPAITAGAAISGAYMGDKMCPISETTVLVPSITGAKLSAHIRAMMWTVLPSFGIAAVLFLVLSLRADPSTTALDTTQAKAALDSTFNIGPITLLPIVILIVLSVLRFPPFVAIYLTALGSGVLACFTQRNVVDTFVNDPSLGVVLTSIKAIVSAAGTGFSLNTGNPSIDPLFSGGGMSSMLSTLWLIIGALTFGAVMERAGYLEALVAPLLKHATTGGRLTL